MKKIYFSLFTLFSFVAVAQPTIPSAVMSNQPFSWGNQLKTSADSCGSFFNNYVGLGKTSLIRIERLRTGNATESGNYNGRAQKFSAPQPIEISGIEFYSYIDSNPAVDSLMVITTLNEYDASGNTLGAELARDTVYVFHNSFNPTNDPVPSISVQSEFDTPVVVTSDYMVAIYTPTDDSLRILANEFSVNDGAGEGLGYALYDNASYPTFYGWYDMLQDFSADYDFLISPKIAFKQPNEFTLSDTILCPDSNPLCLTYAQAPIQSVKQYHSDYADPTDNISIIWDDGTSTDDTIYACHSYTNSGIYNINLLDTIHNWSNGTPHCIIDLEKEIEVEDSIDISFTHSLSNFDVTFTTTAVNVDSVWWDFGDNSTGSSDLNPTHTYPGPGTYNVWLYSFNDCMTKSIFTTINIQPSHIFENNSQTFTIYPNPANQSIVLTSNGKGETVKIYNIAGEIVYSNKNIEEKTTIDVSDLINGTYFVSMQSKDDTSTKKLSIKH